MNKPSFVAWEKSGSPDALTEYGKYVMLGQCSLCGRKEKVVAVKRVASFYFTDWEDYSNDDKPMWCNSCIWAFSEKNNRSEALYITDGEMHSSYQVQSFKTLLAKPLDEHTAVSVALKKNKHVLPYAQWGTIRIEDINLPWTSREVLWLQKVSRLIELGFTIGDIKKDDSPSFSVIIILNKEQSLEAYSLWDSIKPLRSYPQLFVFILELHKTASRQYSTVR